MSYTGATRFAACLEHACIQACNYLQVVASICLDPDKTPLHFSASPHAASAHDAFILVYPNVRIEITINQPEWFFSHDTLHVNSVIIHPISKLAIEHGL